VLQKLDPSFAPVAEAIQLWTSEPKDTNWAALSLATKRSRIARLLKPEMDDIQTNDANFFAKSILTEPGNDGVVILQVDDLFRSERHFATFLSILGAVLPEGVNETGRAIPCAAVVRHPRLLDATASVYGSTMDNSVLNTDCEMTLPPIPALAALDEKIKKAWPECDGTIRFAAYRTYEVSLTSARLGIATHASDAKTPHLRGVTATDMSAARAQLAAYYTHYLGMQRQASEAMASDAVIGLMKTGQECE
jgi:hypothetical protein